jgi:hypothetical protein
MIMCRITNKRIAIVVLSALTALAVAVVVLEVVILPRDSGSANWIRVVHPRQFTDEMKLKSNEKGIWNRLQLDGQLRSDDQERRVFYYVPTDLETTQIDPIKVPETMAVYEVVTPSSLSNMEKAKSLLVRFGVDQSFRINKWQDVTRNPDDYESFLHADELIKEGLRYPGDTVACVAGASSAIDGSRITVSIDAIRGRVRMTNTKMFSNEAGPIPAGFDAETLALTKLEELGLLPESYDIEGYGGKMRQRAGEEPQMMTASVKIRPGVGEYPVRGGRSFSGVIEFNSKGELVSLDMDWPTLKAGKKVRIKTPTEALQDLFSDKVLDKSDGAAHVLLERMSLCYLAPPQSDAPLTLSPGYYIQGLILRTWSGSSGCSTKVEPKEFEALVPAL